MPDNPNAMPDSTAVRVALWRALHLEVDPPPHVLEDKIGLRLAAPDDGWRHRPDMDPQFTRRFRASIVARARFIEDLVVEQAGRGVIQYVILGAGLDSFAQRRPKIASGLPIFEVDRPGPQAWKQQRLIELGFGIPEWLQLVPVDFEVAGWSWWERLAAAGFDMTFLLPLELADPEERPGLQLAEKGARASGTPFISFFTPPEILALARDAGFREAQHLSAAVLAERYFAGRTHGLRPPNNAEELLIATT